MTELSAARRFVVGHQEVIEAKQRALDFQRDVHAIGRHRLPFDVPDRIIEQLQFFDLDRRDLRNLLFAAAGRDGRAGRSV
jgi:hypothetical protein